MSDCLYRPQVFYEDAALANVFKSTMDYRKLGKRRFDGYNLPMSSYLEWIAIATSRNDLSQQEAHLASFLSKTPPSCNKNKKGKVLKSTGLKTTYIIATLASDSSSITHELLHYFYHIQPDYRALAFRHFNSLSDKARKELNAFLLGKGYHPSKHEDEFQAFLVEDNGIFARFKGGVGKEFTVAAAELSAMALPWIKANFEPL